MAPTTGPLSPPPAMPAVAAPAETAGPPDAAAMAAGAAAGGAAAPMAGNGTSPAGNGTATAGGVGGANNTAAAVQPQAMPPEEEDDMGDPRVRLVATRTELFDALRAAGVEHIVLTEHLNYSEPFGVGALLSASGPTRVIRVHPLLFSPRVSFGASAMLLRPFAIACSATCLPCGVWRPLRLAKGAGQLCKGRADNGAADARAVHPRYPAAAAEPHDGRPGLVAAQLVRPCRLRPYRGAPGGARARRRHHQHGW